MTRPYLSNDGSPGVPSFSLTMCHRPDAESTLALQYEGGGKDGAKVTLTLALTLTHPHPNPNQ